MTIVSLVVLLVVTILLMWQFVGYPLLMAVVAMTHNEERFIDTHLPSVTIAVPTFNEEKSIAARIDNLCSLDYPSELLEILVVDSGSKDATAAIVEAATRMRNSVPLRLIREETRKGKASAVNLAAAEAAGEIVLVTDANSMFNKEALREIMPQFNDRQTGAVGGRFTVCNAGHNPLAASAQFYWDLECIMRRGEASIDSACLMHGEIEAIRKELVNADPSIISEDLDASIQIRRKGFRIGYARHAIAYEPTPTTVREQIIQRKKTTIGTIQCIRKHWRYLLVPRDVYGLLIFSSHKTLPIISPFLIASVLALYLLNPDPNVVLMHFTVSAIAFSILLVILLNLRTRLTEGKGRKADRASLARILRYVLLNEYLVLLSWKDYLLGRYSVLWKKVESNR